MRGPRARPRSEFSLLAWLQAIVMVAALLWLALCTLLGVGGDDAAEEHWK